MTVVLDAVAPALGDGTAFTGGAAVAAGVVAGVPVAAGVAAVVPCRRMALLFLL